MVLMKNMIFEGDKYEEVSDKLQNLILQLTDEEFWEYVKSWYDEQLLMHTINNWDLETKKDAIKELIEIIKISVNPNRLKGWNDTIHKR